MIVRSTCCFPIKGQFVAVGFRHINFTIGMNDICILFSLISIGLSSIIGDIQSVISTVIGIHSTTDIPVVIPCPAAIGKIPSISFGTFSKSQMNARATVFLVVHTATFDHALNSPPQSLVIYIIYDIRLQTVKSKESSSPVVADNNVPLDRIESLNSVCSHSKPFP